MELGTLSLVMNKNILESNIVFIVIIKSIFFSYDSPFAKEDLTTFYVLVDKSHMKDKIHKNST